LQIPIPILGIATPKEILRDARIPPVAMQQKTGRKGHTMRRKYFGEECVFEFVWQHCDNDGLWSGSPGTLAAKFNVSEDEAQDMLGELCDRNLIQRLGNSTFIVARWRERDDAGEEESGVNENRSL
jgi:hypothetical protein